MQIKTMTRLALHTCLERPSSKRTQITNVGEDVEKREHLCTVGWNVNWYSYYRKQYGSSSKIKNTNTIWSRNSTPGYVPNEKENSNLKMYMDPNVDRSIIYNSQDIEAA